MYHSFFLLVWQCCVASLSVTTLKIFMFPVTLTFIFLLLCRHSSLLQVTRPSCCNLLIPFKTLVNGATSSRFLILPYFTTLWGEMGYYNSQAHKAYPLFHTNFMTFCFKAPCQFTALLNWHFLISGKHPLAGCTCGQCWECANLTMQNKTWRLQAHRKLCPSQRVHYLVQTPWFIKFFCSTHKCQDDTPNCGTKKTDKMMKNHCNSLNCSNTYDLWVLKWLSTKACEVNLNIHDRTRDSDYMENPPSVRSLVTTNLVWTKYLRWWQITQPLV